MQLVIAAVALERKYIKTRGQGRYRDGATHGRDDLLFPPFLYTQKTIHVRLPGSQWTYGSRRGDHDLP